MLGSGGREAGWPVLSRPVLECRPRARGTERGASWNAPHCGSNPPAATPSWPPRGASGFNRTRVAPPVFVALRAACSFTRSGARDKSVFWAHRCLASAGSAIFGTPLM